jgi:hypothetical protein
VTSQDSRARQKYLQTVCFGEQSWPQMTIIA